MTLSERINKDLSQAMKAREETRVSTLRMLKAAVKNKSVEKGEELTDEEVRGVVSSLIRKGKEAQEEFIRGGREDLASKEEQDLAVLYDYLPKQLGPAEIEKNLRDIISEISAESPKDLGRVMKAAMSQMAGRAQGKEVNEIAKKLLT